MKEIGGYFQLEDFEGKEYYPDLIHLNLGRTSLLYILEVLDIKKLAVPYFLCESVITACEKEGIALSYYHIGTDFLPVPGWEPDTDTYVYLVNYYGQLTDPIIRICSSRFPKLIADYTHSFFQKPLPEIITLYSCRKYFGLPDGAYVHLPGHSKDPVLKADQSFSRMSHILGRYENCASAYYQDMLDTANSFDREPVKAMSKLTRNLLKAIPYDRVKKRREANFAFLQEQLRAQNALAPTMPEGPFTYPFYYKNGPDLKKALACRKIFVPTYWSNVILAMEPDCPEHDYAANILPLPCDQRYLPEDMAVVASAVAEEIEKLEN